MNDPYSVLGVDPSASDEEIKRTYRELARKYHPDNYQNNPLADLAEEKMKEINEAYDTITRNRAGNSSGGYGSAGAYQTQGQQYGYQRQENGSTVFAQARQCINRGDINGAEQLLRSAPQQTAEWHFLYGHIAYQKGWLDEATQHFRSACNMEPGNSEYRQTLSMMQRGGFGYRPAAYGSTNCNPLTACLCFSMMAPGSCFFVPYC